MEYTYDEGIRTVEKLILANNKLSEGVVESIRKLVRKTGRRAYDSGRYINHLELVFCGTHEYLTLRIYESEINSTKVNTRIITSFDLHGTVLVSVQTYTYLIDDPNGGVLFTRKQNRDMLYDKLQ